MKMATIRPVQLKCELRFSERIDSLMCNFRWHTGILLVILWMAFRVEPAPASNGSPGSSSSQWADRIHTELDNNCPGTDTGFVPAEHPASFQAEIIAVYPHDPEAFTQGLIWLDGFLYESTGRLGHSTLRRVDLHTGEVLELKALSDELFGEGLTVWKDWLIQLTLHSGKALVYDRYRLELVRVYRYDGEGWGLTSDGERLIMSDGSATLRFYDPTTFRKLGERTIKEDGKPLTGLNELQMVGELLYANILFEDRIAMIDLVSGRAVGWLHMEHLLSPEEREPPVNILNGIAYDEENDRLFVTGKLWPKLFEIRCGELASGSTR